jgi:radical SAM superfamily enzyme YgiQ (UPF0313 family)
MMLRGTSPMKVLFVADRMILEQEPLGMMYISALLKQHGHECELISMDSCPDLAREVARRAPAVVAFSVSTGLHGKYLQAAREITQHNPVLTIFGGPHPTFFPNFVEENGVDVICRGEGEYPVLRLMDALAQGRDFTSISNLWVKKDGRVFRNAQGPFVTDLDSLPFPDRELVADCRHLYGTGQNYFIAGRGCPYNCTFCFNHVARELGEGHYVRWRSVANLVSEVKLVKDTYSLRYVKFEDDTFILNRRWLEDFCDVYRREIRLPFFCHVRANLVDEGVVQQLREAGCVEVAMGLEAGDEEMRSAILNKGVTSEQLIRACDLLRRAGIRVITQNLFGVPHETVETVLATIDLNMRCRPTHANINFYVPYPGTSLANHAIEDGFFDVKDFDRLPYTFSGEVSTIFLRLERREEIQALARLTRLCVKFPAAYPPIRWIFRRPGLVPLKKGLARIALFLQFLYFRFREIWQRQTRRTR